MKKEMNKPAVAPCNNAAVNSKHTANFHVKPGLKCMYFTSWFHEGIVKTVDNYSKHAHPFIIMDPRDYVLALTELSSGKK